tara:strand:- start:865 stop:1128 length:264 start_codon:yes stop_codon:yes gene_type:complete
LNNEDLDITAILRDNKDLINEIKTINESILKNNEFFLNEIKDKNNEINDLKNEVKEINELFLIQNKELKLLIENSFNINQWKLKKGV